MFIPHLFLPLAARAAMAVEQVLAEAVETHQVKAGIQGVVALPAYRVIQELLARSISRGTKKLC
jgi:hypothetical protein